MNQPLVSILIPCYNAERWLAETITSALAQSWPHKEIVVVDDGSTDRSLIIARGFESSGVQVVTQANRGASGARNTALSHAHGDYLQFLDADDLLATAKIVQQLRSAETVGQDHVFCSTWSRFTLGIEDADFTPQPLCSTLAPIDWVVTKFERNAMMHPAAWLISRSLVEKAGPWDETLSLDDDGEFFTRVVLASRGVHFCRDAISYYRSGITGSLSQTKSEQAWVAAFRSLELATARLRENEDSPRTRHACATVFQRYIYESYPRAAACRKHAKRLIKTLGGSNLLPEGGPKYQLARRLLGWRLAKHLQQISSHR